MFQKFQIHVFLKKNLTLCCQKAKVSFNVLDQLFYRLFQRINVYLTVKWCITKSLYKLGLIFMTIFNI